MSRDEGIYEIEDDWSKKAVLEKNMKDMKIIMIKGIGYFVVGKDSKVTSDTFLNLAVSMESRNITI